jgi:hypothetical protein
MNSKQIAIVALLGSLVSIISLTLSHYFPFPILPYLEFDPAEIIVILAFLLFGPFIAIIIEAIHFLLLNIFSQFPLIGPAAKSIAVLSTILGYYSAFLVLKRSSYEKLMSLGIVFAMILRVGVMTIVNYLFFITIFAGYINYASHSILVTTGIYSSNPLIWILIFTAIYNALHTLLSVIPAASIAKIQSIQKIVIPISTPWFLKFLIKK